MINTTMRSFFKTRINRTSAFVMLVVWILALISGVANACLLEGSGTSAHVVSTKHTNALGAPQVSLSLHVSIETGSEEADDAHTSKQPCLKVCNDGSKSLTKKYSAEQIDPGARVIVAVLWSLIEPIHVQYEQANGSQYAASAMPLRVLYSRLAL